ncbi:MAG: hypothetical protein LT102_13815 [Burkholderiaceae bacterium]|nr:hypothetical protein [Burkholderiaceae bacterium]
MNESQRRAFRALDIGPLWLRRAAREPLHAVPLDPGASPDLSASPAASTLFALADEEGAWLFVGEAAPAIASEAGGLLAPEPARLLGRMLFALGLRPAHRAVLFDESAERPAPQVVVALGAVAAQALLGVDQPLAALRGRVHEWRFAHQQVPLVVSAHPARLLEAAHEKAAAWADLCLARDAAARTVSACSGRSAPPSRTRAGSPDGGG